MLRGVFSQMYGASTPPYTTEPIDSRPSLMMRAFSLWYAMLAEFVLIPSFVYTLLGFFTLDDVKEHH